MLALARTRNTTTCPAKRVSPPTEFGPIKCFNPAKSWELGCYAEQSKRINPLADAPFSTIMTRITRDINDDDPIKNILIQIPNGETNIYVGYNLANGYNSGTQEGQGNVLVTEQKAARYYVSGLRAKLDINDSYKINTLDYNIFNTKYVYYQNIIQR